MSTQEIELVCSAVVGGLIVVGLTVVVSILVHHLFKD